jgi:hypothetical protein
MGVMFLFFSQAMPGTLLIYNNSVLGLTCFLVYCLLFIFNF